MKYLLFSQIMILLFEVFKKQLYISIKLVKSKNIIITSIIINLSLIKKYDKNIININIWW